LKNQEPHNVIGVIDVGAPKNIGWAIIGPDGEETGQNLDEFTERFAELSEGRSAALGFEAPLFIPIGRPVAKLTTQRNGDNGKPWSAAAGATVTTIGLAVVSHVLADLRQRLPLKIATLDWTAWPSGDALLLFEAFVSGANHAAPGEHELDAQNAARAFHTAQPDLDAANAISKKHVLSLVGICMARTGWAKQIPAFFQNLAS